MVLQELMTSSNPVLTIGDQISEPLRVHEGLGLDAARTRVLAMLAALGIPDPERRIGAYPHEFSGGMRQRDLTVLSGTALRPLRPQLRYVFQDPFASLSARMAVAEIFTEGLAIQRIGNQRERLQRVEEALRAVEKSRRTWSICCAICRRAVG